jgi:hypothetical protein
VIVFDDVDVEKVLDMLRDGEVPQCRPGVRVADALLRAFVHLSAVQWKGSPRARSAAGRRSAR